MRIEKCSYEGIDVIKCSSGIAELMITTEFGPRIAFYGKADGINLLYWDPSGYERNGWKLYGGHRVWLTRPMADESEDTYLADNDPCQVDLKDNKLTVEAPINAAGIVRGMIIEEVGSDMRITNYLRNDGNLLYSAGVWAPTCINPDGGKRFAVSIGDDGASWDLVKIVIPRQFNGAKIPVNDSQITFNDNYMVVEPQGSVMKRCLFSAQGVVAMTWPEKSLTFLKSVDVVRDGNYQMGGCNTAIFVGQDNFMVEMETYGEEQSIYPGETIVHSELWQLKDEEMSFE